MPGTDGITPRISLLCATRWAGTNNRAALITLFPLPPSLLAGSLTGIQRRLYVGFCPLHPAGAVQLCYENPSFSLFFPQLSRSRSRSARLATGLTGAVPIGTG